MIGAFSAVMFAAFGLFSRSLRSELDARFGRLDARIDGLEQRLDARIDGLEQRLDAKIDNLGHLVGVRLDAVESDLHLIKGHLLGQRSAYPRR